MPLGVLKNSKPEFIQGMIYPGIYYMLRAGERADRNKVYIKSFISLKCLMLQFFATHIRRQNELTGNLMCAAKMGSGTGKTVDL